VVRGPLALARLEVDPARAAPGRQGWREQDMVDAQSPSHQVNCFSGCSKRRNASARPAPSSSRNAARSASEKWILPSQRFGLCTSRGSGAMFRSPSTAMPGALRNHRVSASYQRSLYAYFSVPGASPFGA
jgi:hypothetical protein